MKKAFAYQIITAAMIALALACAAFFWLSADFAPDDASGRVAPLRGGWYYFDGAGNKVSVVLPCAVAAGETLELFHDAGDGIRPGVVLATHAAAYDVEIYAGNELIYRYQDQGREVNLAVRGNIVCSGSIPESQAQSGVRLRYHSPSGKYSLSEITLSTERALVKRVFSGSLFVLFVSVAMLVLGLITLLFGTAMALQRDEDRRIFFIGLFLVGCGLWCLTDSPFVHLLGDYGEKIFTLDFYLFMLMPIPLAYFVLSTADMKKHKMLLAVPMIYYANIVAQSLLAAFGVFTFFRMLYATHILMMFSGVISPLYVLLREYRAEKKPEVLLCIRALTSVGILGAVAIFLYVFFGYATYQAVYQTGLLLLMSVLLSALLKEFMQSVRYRAEANLYKQLSEQDKLTKLDNLRSFDALLEKMENGSLKYKNAALLFMDVNFLKKANDTYGHDFGDRLLVSAARCIRGAFDGAGYCYRIGGDEFCAVLLDPSCAPEELLARLRAETDRFNRDESLPLALSIACGCCLLKENGIRRTVSEWKAEADNRMYAEKKRIKAERQPCE